MFPGLDLYRSDPAEHRVTADFRIEWMIYVDRDLSQVWKFPRRQCRCDSDSPGSKNETATLSRNPCLYTPPYPGVCPCLQAFSAESVQEMVPWYRGSPSLRDRHAWLCFE